MRTITNLMIHDYRLMKLKYDFCGFQIDRRTSLSFHHLIVPRCKSKEYGIEAEGYVKWNGAILVQDTSHDYIHLIEKYDKQVYGYITQEMIAQNQKGYLDPKNIRNIHDLMWYFEDHYEKDLRDDKGKKLIKKQFKTKRRQF